MKELSIEEMTSLRGGFHDRNRATVIARDNTAIAVPVNVVIGSANRSGGLGGVTQAASANAGNQSVSITQSN
jgi:hypothetical protein